MFEPFIDRALAAGVGVAVVGGVLGCFVVWRRMAYFGDSLAHGALLGVTFGLFFNISTGFTALVMGCVVAVLLVLLRRSGTLAADTILGLLSHATLAVGLLAIGFITSQKVHVHSILFGDILTVTTGDLYRIYGGAAVVLTLTFFNWDRFVLMTVNQDIAKAEGVDTFKMEMLLMFLLAVVVSVAFRVVGVLLITSMLIISPAAARSVSASPGAMAAVACAVGISSVFAGIFTSLYYDIPSGPSIVTAAAVFFIVLFVGALLFKRIAGKRFAREVIQ